MASNGNDSCGRRLLDRRSFTGLAMTAFAWLVRQSTEVRAAEPAGSIEDMKGEGFAEASGAPRRPLALRAAVYMEDRIGTGPVSRLTIHLGRQTRLHLGERVRITIDRYLVGAGGELTLEAGPMLLDRPAGAAQPALQIRTPFALIAVRGTRFFAGPSRGVFGVFVERGRVSVTAGGREVVLAQGEGTDIRRPGDPPTPPVRWGQERIRDARASVL
jgi:hypothetical protein